VLNASERAIPHTSNPHSQRSSLAPSVTHWAITGAMPPPRSSATTDSRRSSVEACVHTGLGAVGLRVRPARDR